MKKGVDAPGCHAYYKKFLRGSPDTIILIFRTAKNVWAREFSRVSNNGKVLNSNEREKYFKQNN